MSGGAGTLAVIYAPVCRLADFGYSRFFRTEGPEGMEINNMLDSAAGTPVYMAPEALACVVEQNAHYNQLVDIWSAGAIIYRVVVGKSTSKQ